MLWFNQIVELFDQQEGKGTINVIVTVTVTKER